MAVEDRNIPLRTVYRLSQYYRALLSHGVEGYISSDKLAELSGLNSAIVRRDLSYFGKFGVPGIGYPVSELRDKLLRILGIDKQWKLAIVGMGNLGSALTGYRGFEEKGFNVVAVFDNDPAKIGKSICSMVVQDIGCLTEEVKKKGINMAVITVPSFSAEDVLKKVEESGIEAILNFAPVKIDAPSDVSIVNIDIGIELERLSFLALRKKS